MQRITEALEREIDPKGPGKETSRILPNLKLVRLSAKSDGKISLQFRNEKSGGTEEWTAEHVILALPRGPLEQLANDNPAVFCADALEDIKSVFGFPLLKFFLAVKKRWWEQDETMTNRYATRIPTRELHFRASSVHESRKGFVMVYTDRPATGFWSNYIAHVPEHVGDPSHLTGKQDEPEQGKPDLNVRLINKARQYLGAHGVKLEQEDIDFYGIRDWGREPYLGAAHSWYPERQSWTILKNLSAFAPGSSYADGDRDKSVIHVCGEAYSDYQAFIEGALRSAEHVLHRILPDAFPESPTSWLCEATCSCRKTSEAKVAPKEE
jgi:hypothetical protein